MSEPSAASSLRHLAGRRVVVTGAAGFIGGHLVEALLRLPIAGLVALDSLAFGAAERMRSPDPRFSSHTLRLGRGVEEALRPLLEGVDLVFHLAAEKHNQSRGRPAELLDANIDGTSALLAAAAAAGAPRVVFTSSLYAYGRGGPSPWRESQVPRPDTLYGTSKLAGEGLCRHYAERLGGSAVGLRLFFTYGSRQFAGAGYKSVILKTCERLAAGLPPVIHGDGRQELDYIHVEDVVEALLRAATAPTDGEVCNVCTGRGVAVADLVAELQAVAGRPDLRPVPAPPDETAGTRRVGDPSRLREWLGFTPAIDLTEGLRRTWHWFLSQNPATP